jgi:hypothetical protein
MSRKKHFTQARPHSHAPAGNRRQVWAVAAAALATLGALALAINSALAPTPPPAGSNTRTATASPPAAAAPANPAAPLPADLRAKLPGRWNRTDADYTISITSVAADGTVQATYANPKPIHVAQASAHQTAGKTALYLELRDRGYPGSNYELIYDPAHDILTGVYHHLGLHQDFDVNFLRAGRAVSENQ